MAERPLVSIVADTLALIRPWPDDEAEDHPGKLLIRWWPRTPQLSTRERIVLHCAAAMWNGDPTATVSSLALLDRRTALALWSLLAEWLALGETRSEEQT